MFIETLNKVTQNCTNAALRMIQSLTLKTKEQGKFKDKGEDVFSNKNLLLCIVRLIHADPMLMLNVRLMKR